MKRWRYGILCGLMGLVLCLCPRARGDGSSELVSNGGFEEGSAEWSVFIPDESQEKDCEFTVVHDHPHSGDACARLSSGDFARFCVGHTPIAVVPGARYRVSAWFCGDSDTRLERRSPGFSIRLNLSGVHLQINADGVVTPGNPPAMTQPLPTEWTEVSAVIEIPPGRTSFGADLFSYVKGALFIDDFSVQKVGSDVSVTPLANGAAYSSLGGASSGGGPTPQVMPANPGPVTTDAQIVAELDTDSPGMEKVKAAVQSGDLAAIQKAYLEFRREDSKARWKTMPWDKPAAPTDAAADLVANHYVTRGLYHYGPPATFMGKDYNWLYNPVAHDDPAFSNEFTYCVVARTESWLHLADAYWKTGNEKYAQAWVEQMEDFARKNPMTFAEARGQATVWRSLDSATRMDVVWPECYYHFLNSPYFTPEAQWTYVKLMRDHANRLVGGLDFGFPKTGNWVTDECDALYTIGALFPELRDAAGWRDKAIDRLTVELKRSVDPDGMETELTPGYHFGALGQFRGPLDLAKLNNLSIPSLFEGRILDMYRAPVIVMQQNGQDVCTNDSWIVNARTEAKASLGVGYDPVLTWAASGGRAGTPLPDSTCLPYSGFYAMRSGWNGNDMYVFFRAGPPGSGHEHQDMLEVTLRAWDNDLLVDPGTYAYDRSAFRRYFVGTAAHNTIMVDGKWQHRLNNEPPVVEPANNPWVTTPLFDFVAGTYDEGYQENVYAPIEFMPVKWVGGVDKSVTHTRRVLYLRPYYVLVVDTLDGTGEHTFEAHYHIGAANGTTQNAASAGHVDPDTQAYFSDRGSNANLSIVPLDRDHLTVDVVEGQKNPVLGWGTKDGKAIPAPAVRFIKRQEAPALFATLLYPYQMDAEPSVTGQDFANSADLWGHTIDTPRERAEIVVSKDGSSRPISFQSGSIGATVNAFAAGMVVRQPAGQSDCYVGGWGIRDYDDGSIAFSSESGASVAFTRGPNPIFFNGGADTTVLTLTRPAARQISLAPQKWTDSDGSPATAPTLFAPIVSGKK